MATTFTKLKLSSSTDGMGISLGNSSPGNLIHTASATALDEIWAWCQNTSTTAVKVTVEYGGATAAQNIEVTVPGESGLLLVVPGLILTNSLTVKAFAGTTSVLTIHGYVNRIT